ncbi:MAG: hypothetical protein ABF479_00350 [Gluconacetobacter sp.]
MAHEAVTHEPPYIAPFFVHAGAFLDGDAELKGEHNSLDAAKAQAAQARHDQLFASVIDAYGFEVEAWS